MIIKGKVHIFGDNINTDDIIAAKYLDSQDPAFLGSKCMENIDSGFPQRVKPGDIIVAGKNFGCGSSREHAPWALKGCGISLVMAESFARIFFRNCINIGLPIVEIGRSADFTAGDELRVDLAAGRITNERTAAIFKTQAFPEFLQNIVRAGGLIPWIQNVKKEADA